MKLVNPLDAAWLYVDSPATPMHVGSLQIFSPPKNAPADFARRLVNVLRNNRKFAPPFSLQVLPHALQKLVPFWVETEPDVHHHLQRWALPTPGAEGQLDALISHLQSQPLDPTRPLWECHLIEGLPEGRYAMYTKIHHSLMDGIGGVRLLQAVLSADPNCCDLPAPWAPHPDMGQPEHLEPPADRSAQPRRGWLDAVADQARALPGVARAFVTLARAATGRGPKHLVAPYTAPVTMFNGRISSARHYARLQLDLERVRALARRAGVTINDVFLCLCGGALRRYLRERDALPAASLTAGLPVSVRPDGDMTPGTAITFIAARLGTELEDPLERLRVIHDSTRAAKDHLRGLDHTALTEYTLLLMAPYILKLVAGLGAVGKPAFNLAISNVPGPGAPLYFNGARLEAMYPMSLVTHGQGLNITVLSYDGKLNVGYTACSKTVPHLHRLVTYTIAALDELEKLAPALTGKRGEKGAAERKRA